MKRLSIPSTLPPWATPLQRDQEALAVLERWRDETVARLSRKGLTPNRRTRRAFARIETLRRTVAYHVEAVRARQPELDAFAKRVAAVDSAHERAQRLTESPPSRRWWRAGRHEA